MTEIAQIVATGATDPRALRDLNERFERASAAYRGAWRPPTPDPLTAEEIAESDMEDGPIVDEDDMIGVRLGRLNALITERNALRDRLARAADWEMRQYDLRQLAETARLYVRDPCPSNLADLAGEVARYEEALLATPTDGAARAGDAAGDEGGAT